MENRIPKWARPFCEERSCSICNSPHVYFERPEVWTEEVQILGGNMIQFNNFALKCWCKDCFEDCGGKHV
jgi:hypothetical protein